MRCVYFRNASTHEPCFGELRPGVTPCLDPIVGRLVITDGDGTHRYDLCHDHFRMREGNVACKVAAKVTLERLP